MIAECGGHARVIVERGNVLVIAEWGACTSDSREGDMHW